MVGSQIGLGEFACLGAALCWALAIAWFRRPIGDYGPWAVNLGKSCIAALLLGSTTLVLGQGGRLLAAPPWDLLLIALSGVIGLALGDTALFAAVHRLGGHRALLLQTLAPVFAAVLAYGWHGERLSGQRLAGAVVILLGVLLVVAPGRRAGSRPVEATGVALGVLAAFGQGSGLVLAKAGMAEVPPLPASALRLAAAASALLLALSLSRRRRDIRQVLGSARALRRIAGPALLGTYLGIFLMMTGLALAPTSVAAVLLATSPVFSLFVDHWLAASPITGRGLAGTALAVLGVWILSTAPA